MKLRIWKGELTFPNVRTSGIQEIACEDQVNETSFYVGLQFTNITNETCQALNDRTLSHELLAKPLSWQIYHVLVWIYLLSELNGIFLALLRLRYRFSKWWPAALFCLSIVTQAVAVVTWLIYLNLNQKPNTFVWSAVIKLNLTVLFASFIIKIIPVK